MQRDTRRLCASWHASRRDEDLGIDQLVDLRRSQPRPEQVARLFEKAVAGARFGVLRQRVPLILQPVTAAATGAQDYCR